MTFPRTISRPDICARSIAAFLAAATLSHAVTYHVDLGDTVVENGLLNFTSGLTKTGGGALILTNNTNTYTGATVIQAGSVVITNVGSLGATSSITVLDDGNGSSGQLVLGGTYAPQTFDFSPFGGLALAGGHGMSAQSFASVGNNTILGPIVVSSTTATRLTSAFGTATLPNYSTGAGVISAFNGSGHWALGGVSGSGVLQKQGLGTLVLTSNNTNSGGVDLSGGFVRVSSAANLGTSSAPNAISFSGGTLEVRTDTPDFSARKVMLAGGDGTIHLDRAIAGSGLNQTVAFSDLLLSPGRTFVLNGRNGYGATFSGADGIIGGAGMGTNSIANNLNGPLTLAADLWNNSSTAAATLGFTGSGDTLVTGSILASGLAAHRLAKSGTGTLTIRGTASTYRGSTDIAGGTVAIRGFGAFGDPAINVSPIRLGTGANNVVLNLLGAEGTGAGDTTARPFHLPAQAGGGGRINANQAGSSPTAFLLSGNITAPSTGPARMLTLGGGNALDNEISGVISNGTGATVAVTKSDPGTWVLSGANTYTGNTTITGGTLKLKASAAASTVVHDSSTIVFTFDSNQNAGGTLELVGLPGVATTETLGTLAPGSGAATVRLTPGAGGQASLVFTGLGGNPNFGPSVNFIAPTALDTITLTTGPTGFLRAAAYYNGADFAYSAGGQLRAPIYGSDAGFVTSAGSLTAGAHNRINGSFSSSATTIASLKIAGSQTLVLTGALGISPLGGTAGGILVSGGEATITGGAVGALGGAELVIRVDGPADSLTLASPIAPSAIGGFTKNGTGSLILRGLNAQRGPTHINEGVVRLAGAGRLSSAGQTLNLRQGATLDLNGVSTGTSIGTFNGAGVVTNSGSAAATLTVGNNNGIGVFSGTIRDGTNLIHVVKEGSNNTTWSGMSTYTGSTTIAASGTLTATNLADIGQRSAIGRGNAADDASNAASLAFTGPSAGTSVGSLSYTGAGSISIDRLFTLASTSTLAGGRILANGGTLIFNKTTPIAYTLAASTVNQTLKLGGSSLGDNRLNLRLINPSGAELGVTKEGTGTWLLGNETNSFTGATTVSGGRLVAVDGSSLPTASPLVFDGTPNAGGVLQTSGNFTRAVVPTPVSGLGGVHWIGSGGFAAWDAKLIVDLSAGASLTWGANGFVETSGTSASSLVLNSSTALFETELKNNIDLNGFLRTVQVDDNPSTSLDFATLSGALSGSGAGLIKAGAGTLQLLGANTYDGETRLDAGTLVATSLGSHGSPSSSVGGGALAAPIAFAAPAQSSATLQYVGAGETSDRPIVLTTGGGSATIDSSGSGALVLSAVSNASTATRTLSLRGSNSDANEITSVLANNGSQLSVSKLDSGTWILSGANTYSGIGGTTVNGGALGIGNNSALGFVPLRISDASVFAHGGDRTISNTVLLSGSAAGVIGIHSLTLTSLLTFGVNGSSSLAVNLPTGKQLTIDFGITVTLNQPTPQDAILDFNGAGRTVVNGVVRNNSDVPPRTAGLRNTSGALVLNGANTYTGITEVNGGEVLVHGSIVGLVTVNGGTLGGTGTVGSVIAFGGELSPGGSIGILTVNSSTTMLTGSTFALEISPATLTGDRLITLGDLLLDPSGGVELSIGVAGGDMALGLGMRFPFIDYGGAWNGGLFSVFGEPISDETEYFQIGANVFALDYDDGGHSVSLVIVPEPTAAALGGIGLLAGLWRRRERCC